MIQRLNLKEKYLEAAALFLVFSTPIHAGEKIAKPWVFQTHPVAMISKFGASDQKNALFFVSNRSCKTEIVAWLAASNPDQSDSIKADHQNLRFNAILPDETKTLVENITLQGFLAGNGYESDPPVSIASLHIGSIQHASLITEWLALGVTGFEIEARGDQIFQDGQEYWNTDGLEGALQSMTSWCNSHQLGKRKI